MKLLLLKKVGNITILFKAHYVLRTSYCFNKANFNLTRTFTQTKNDNTKVNQLCSMLSSPCKKDLL